MSELAKGAPPTPLLEVSGLEKLLGGELVLRGVDLKVMPGEVVCIVGPSGCGKSTLLRCIDMLIDPDAGWVKLDGELMGYRMANNASLVREPPRKVNAQRARIGMIFQQFNLWPHLTVLGNVMKAQMVVLERKEPEAHAKAVQILTRVGLEDKFEAYPHELSGGQQQRVAIARALAMDPRLMLCDEPTASLDPELIHEVLSVLRQLAEEGMTMVIVTHELGFAAKFADRIVFMDQGRIVEQGPPGELLEHPKTDRLKQFLSRLRRDPVQTAS